MQATSLPKLESAATARNQKLPWGNAGRRRKPRRQEREPAPPSLGKRRSSHRITVEGTLYTLLAMLIGLAALNTGANLLYFVLALMLALLMLNAPLARWNMKKLKFERSLPLEFFAGEPARGMLTVRNEKRFFSSYAVRAHDVILGPLATDGRPAGELHEVTLGAYALEVPARGEARLPVEFTLPARGMYQLREVRLVSRFPFGFFEKTRRWLEPGKLLVYPRLLPVLPVMRQCARALGDLTGSRKGQGAGFYGVRDYQSGDSIRLIHWGLSAKGQGLKVKEFEQEESRSFLIMFDLRCEAEPSDETRNAFEKTASLAATLTCYLLDNGAKAGLWTPLGNIPPAQGARHRQRIMRALAQIQPLPPDAPVKPLSGAARDAAQIWLDYQKRGLSAERGRVAPNQGAGNHVIDVNRVLMDVDISQKALQ